jgi:hypothetical protein
MDPDIGIAPKECRHMGTCLHPSHQFHQFREQERD